MSQFAKNSEEFTRASEAVSEAQEEARFRLADLTGDAAGRAEAELERERIGQDLLDVYDRHGVVARIAPKQPPDA